MASQATTDDLWKLQWSVGVGCQRVRTCMVSGFLCPWNFLVCTYDEIRVGLVACLVSYPVPCDLTWTNAHSLTGDRDQGPI